MTSGRTLSRRGAHLSTEALENIFAVCFPRQDAGLCLPQGVMKRSWRPFAVSLQLLSTVRQSAFVALLKSPAGAKRRWSFGFAARNAAQRSAPSTRVSFVA